MSVLALSGRRARSAIRPECSCRPAHGLLDAISRLFEAKGVHGRASFVGIQLECTAFDDAAIIPVSRLKSTPHPAEPDIPVLVKRVLQKPERAQMNLASKVFATAKRTIGSANRKLRTSTHKPI